MTLYSKQYWNMVQTFAYYGFRMRDQSTTLGFLWTLLHPLILFSILYLLFKQRLGAEIPHFGVYLLIGIVHWNMFATATSKAVNSLIARRDMVVGMNFPRELIVFGDVGAALLSSALEFGVLVLFAAIIAVPVSPLWLLLPFVFIIQAIFSLAVALILSAANVFVRDVERIWTLVIRIGFFAVPIFYPITILSDPVARRVTVRNRVHLDRGIDITQLRNGVLSPGRNRICGETLDGIDKTGKCYEAISSEAVDCAVDAAIHPRTRPEIEPNTKFRGAQEHLFGNRRGRQGRAHR
jgi:ABC-2 type transport system permease protein